MTCRRQRDSRYTLGVPSFSGVFSSFLWCGTLCACEPDLQSYDSNCCQPFVEAPVRTAFLAAYGPQLQLVLPQNRIQSRFEVLLAFRPQLAALHRQRLLNRLDPTE